MSNNDAMVEKVLKDAKVIAVVGLSSDPDKPSFEVAHYLQSKGYFRHLSIRQVKRTKQA